MLTIWRLVRNTIAGGLGWLAFVVAWRRVLASGDAVGVAGVVLVAVGFAAVIAIMRLWVGHNRRIYARKGPRRGRQASTQVTPVVDSLGRPLVITADRWDREVVVSLSALGHKHIDGAR